MEFASFDSGDDGDGNSVGLMEKFNMFVMLEEFVDGMPPFRHIIVRQV